MYDQDKRAWQLVNTLHKATTNPRQIEIIADALNYDPERLTQDIQCLYKRFTEPLEDTSKHKNYCTFD